MQDQIKLLGASILSIRTVNSLNFSVTSEADADAPDHTILRDSSIEDTEDSTMLPDMTCSDTAAPPLLSPNTDSTTSTPNQGPSKQSEDKPPQKERIFRCRHCIFEVNNKVEFWKHARIHIKPEKLLECQQCSFVTEYRHHLEYHVRNHLNSKPFSCDRCPYRCVNRSMLNSHMKSHTNVCHYRCQDCSYATKYCHSLKTHLRKNGHRPAPGINLDTSKLMPSAFLSQMSPKESPDKSFIKPFSPPTAEICPRLPLSHYNSDMASLPDFDQYFAQLRSYLQSSLPQNYVPPAYMRSNIAAPTPLSPYSSYFGRPPTSSFGLTPWLGHNFSMFASPVPSPPEHPQNFNNDNDSSSRADSSPESSLLDLRVKSKKDKDENLKASKSGRLDFICQKLNSAKSKGVHSNSTQAHKSGNLAKECPHCEIIFKEDFMFQSHMSYHSAKDPMTCSGCHTRCQNKIDFFTHFNRIPHV